MIEEVSLFASYRTLAIFFASFSTAGRLLAVMDTKKYLLKNRVFSAVLHKQICSGIFFGCFVIESFVSRMLLGFLQGVKRQITLKIEEKNNNERTHSINKNLLNF